MFGTQMIVGQKFYNDRTHQGKQAQKQKKDATIIGNAPKIWQKESAAILNMYWWTHCDIA